MPDHPFPRALPEAHRYRALLLDMGGHVIRVRMFAAGDDEEAFGITRTMLDGRVLELWDGPRFVRRFGSVEP
ncbi:hypothetical protein ASG40_08460 [Methylobacterium sp. Leaf399]|uniref:hypothetical protein n=1 Tax=unclassified Methylobacterium TaxID=2615210 RepID=UPI000700645A|nr:MULTISPECIES: hypothetical protein [unclassified Methylobacterium]KQP58553.1 hypothetical protein ASF39_18160 [Methylobacterium sp. Leaf108]KQT12001.1 hypothetical protein ASG40_08460 [Methylobacterium sp. Leaf399]KQT88751.1 hypothetical protein ASG59_15315 [Methylobacterium sp. Leaf466]